MPLSSDPPPLESQDDILEASQSSLAEQVALSDLELHPFRVQHGCDAIQLHRGVRSWAAMTTKGGIIGMYGTKRAECVLHVFIYMYIHKLILLIHGLLFQRNAR